MTLISVHAAPEEIMALLDGELSPSERNAISAHLDQCAECSALAHRFRQTSASLKEWTVPPISASLEASIADIAASRLTLSDKRGHSVPVFRRWKLWVLCGGVPVAAFAIFLFATTTFPSHHSERLLAVPADGKYLSSQATPSPIASLAARGHLMERQSSSPLALTSQSESAATKPASHPVSLRAGSIEASANPAAMIARTVSLMLIVKDVAASRASLDAMLQRHHGYFAQMSINSPNASYRLLQASCAFRSPNWQQLWLI